MLRCFLRLQTLMFITIWTKVVYQVQRSTAHRAMVLHLHPLSPSIVVQEINLRREKEETIISALQVGNGITEAVNCQKSQRYNIEEKKVWGPIFWCFNHVVIFFLCPLVTSGMMMTVSEDFHRSSHLWLPEDTFRGLMHKAMLSCTGLSGELYPRSG